MPAEVDGATIASWEPASETTRVAGGSPRRPGYFVGFGQQPTCTSTFEHSYFSEPTADQIVFVC